MRFTALFPLLLTSLPAQSPDHDRQQLQILNHSIAKSDPDGSVAELLRERAITWKRLAVVDPAAVLSLPLPQGVTRRLAVQNRAWVEERGEWRGKLQTVTVDDFQARRSRRFSIVRSGGRVLEVYPVDAPTADGDVIVRGARLDDKIAAAEIELQRPAIQLLRGERKILGLLVNQPSATLPPSVSPEALRGYLFSGRNSVDSYLREVSGGRMWAAGVVLAPFTIPIAYRCSADFGNFGEVSDAAVTAASAWVDVSSFSSIVIVVAAGESCDGRAFAFGERAMISYSAGSMVFNFNVIAHEVGHTLTLGHASRAIYAGSAPLAGFRQSPWFTLEYGNYWDLMGQNHGHFSAIAKRRLGWLDPSRVAEVTTPGSFTILPHESSGDGVRALRVRRGSSDDDWLWLEYRQPLGFDAFEDGFANSLGLPPLPFGGALVYYENPLTPRNVSLLLEFSSAMTGFRPALNSQVYSQPLPAGRKWEDPYSELSIEAVSASPSGLSVRVGYDSCVTVAPERATHSFQAQSGSVSIYAAQGCPTPVVNYNSWITINSTPNGSGVLSYSVSANASTLPRTGVISIGRRSFVIRQESSVQQPTVSVVPANGSVLPEVPQHFQFTFQNSGGAAQILFADLYFGQDRDCHLVFFPPSSLSMDRDDGVVVSNLAGAPAVQRNSLCSLDWRTASVTAMSDRYELSFDLVFTGEFQGVQPLAASVFSPNSGSNERRQLGVWNIGSCNGSATISPVNAAASGGDGSLQVSMPAGCAWAVTQPPDWITLERTSGNGPASVRFAIAPNPGAARDATLAANGKLLTFQQAGSTACTVTMRPLNVPTSGFSAHFLEVSANGSSCPWAVTGIPAWLTLSPSSGKGNTRIFYMAEANPTAFDRIAQLAIGGKAVPLIQPSGCESTISALADSFPFTGGSSTFQIYTNLSACTWTIDSESWVWPERRTGTGNASVPFTVFGNPDKARRGARVRLTNSVSDVIITQEGRTCSISGALTPSYFPGAGGSGTIQITGDAGCPWELRNVPLWILPFWAVGAGPAKFAFEVTPNTGAERSVTVEVSGTRVTITQAAAVCAVTAAASVTSFDAAGGAGTIRINSYAPGCPWSVAGVPPWMTIPVVAGTGTPQTITFRVAANAGAARSASITVGTSPIVISQAAGTLTVPGLRFVALPPCRAVDTRPGQGKAGSFGPPTLAASESRTIPLPASGCGVPASAKAYALNVTVAPLAPLGYLTLWPSGQPRPLVSTLNAMEGQIVANAAIVPAGAGGAVDVFATGATDVILDINGYFTDQSEGDLVFYPMVPCRVIDTRPAQGTPGAFGPPSLAAATPRSFPLAAGRCGIPLRARAYSLNFTAVPHGPLGFLAAWPTGHARPLVSTLNSFAGKVVANAAIIPAGTAAGIDVLASNPADLIVDINGYFAPDDGTGLLFFAVTPCRAVDTRQGQGIGGDLGMPALIAGQRRDFGLPRSTCGLPDNAAAWSANLTVVPSEPLAFLTAWPAGAPMPLASTLNAFDGYVAANALLVPAGTSGAISIYATSRTDLIVDVNGWFRR